MVVLPMINDCMHLGSDKNSKTISRSPEPKSSVQPAAMEITAKREIMLVCRR